MKKSNKIISFLQSIGNYIADMLQEISIFLKRRAAATGLSLKSFIQIFSCLFFSFLLIGAIYHRIVHTYLEDDLLWYVPLISQLFADNSFWGFFEYLHTGCEMSLSDGLYFSSLISLLGFNFKSYTIVSLVIHFLNAFLLYFLLKKRLNLNTDTSFFSSLIYFAFYGHFHGYVWPFSSHHILIVFFTLLTMSFYLKADELIEQNKYYAKDYRIALVLLVIAAFLRISILIIPIMMFLHILFVTKENKKILLKYTLWLPVFIIFTIYQLIVLVIGGEGNILGGFLDFFYDVFGKSQSPLVFCGIAIFSLLFFFLSRVVLRKFLRNKPDDFFFPILSKVSFVLLFLPHLILICFYSLFGAVNSALYDEAVMRWQLIVMPSGGLWAVFGLIASIVVIFCFLRYMIKENRHLIIFVPWYIILVLYLKHYPDAVPSRYLIYVSPIFCVMFCLFFLEIVPRLFSSKLKKIYISSFYTVLFVVLFVNVVAINMRLLRTQFVDYRWSYDYVKAANVIKQDIQNKGFEPDFLSAKICVSGIKYLPYKEAWAEDMLSIFDFTRYDPFRQTFASVLDNKGTELIVNADCSDAGFNYTVNDFTVLNKEGESVEPFYKLFYSGLASLNKGNPAAALKLLEAAARQKPFLINFGMDSFWFRGGWEEILKRQTAAAVYGTYAGLYDGDDKLNYIDNIAQRETHDYAMVLALLAYLKNTKIEESEDLLKEASLFVSKEDLLEYPLTNYMTQAQAHDFYGFVEANALSFSGRSIINPCLKLESYKGFNIVIHDELYFGLPQAEGEFQLGKFKNKSYKQCFYAKTKQAIRREIDALAADRASVNTSLPESEQEYGDFRILKDGDVYLGFLKTRASGVNKNLEKPLFKSRSFAEAKLVVDTFLDM